MTKATAKPLQRLLESRYHRKGLVVELTADTITIREKGRKRGGSGEVSITAGALYDQLILQWARSQ
jgi:hypothetical protein